VFRNTDNAFILYTTPGFISVKIKKNNRDFIQLNNSMVNFSELQLMRNPSTACASQAGHPRRPEGEEQSSVRAAGEFCFVPPEDCQWVAEKLSLDFLVLLYQDKRIYVNT